MYISYYMYTGKKSGLMKQLFWLH